MQRRLRVCRLLPPRKCLGAHSSRRTLFPARRAVMAAHSAALPPPSTRTSYMRETSRTWSFACNADQRCSERRELRVGLGELVRFDGAAFGKRGRKEIEYDRTFLQGLGQRKPVHFSAQRSRSSEVRRVLPDVQGGIRRAGQDERE